MASYCKIIIVGNLTRKPELKYLQSGTPVAEGGIAYNKTWKDASGQKQEKVSFFDITMFGKQGEAFAQYCDKGSAVLIEGELTQDTWQDKEGQNRSKVKVQANRWTFMGPPKAQQAPQQAPPAPVPQPNYDAPMPGDDPIPF